LDVYPVSMIAAELTGIIERLKPWSVFLPFPGDLHLDHFAIHRAGLVACRPRSDFMVSEVLVYETLSETEWASGVSGFGFSPSLFINIERHMDKKMAALGCYQSQLRKFPHGRSFESVKTLAQFRGITAGFNFAEGFMVERMSIFE